MYSSVKKKKKVLASPPEESELEEAGFRPEGKGNAACAFLLGVWRPLPGGGQRTGACDLSQDRPLEGRCPFLHFAPLGPCSPKRWEQEDIPICH